MLILMKGTGEQPQGWHVDEPVAAGYSRVYFLEKGKILYREGGFTRTLLPGRLYIFPASTPFFMTHDALELFTCTWLHIDFFPAVLSSLLEIPLDEDPIAAGFGSLLHELLSRLAPGAGCVDLAVRSLAEYLGQRYLPVQNSPLEEIVAYMREHFRDSGINVNSLSAHFGYTPEHFIRLFSRHLGVTPYQYLLNLRMYEARRLLLENHSVRATSAAVGYDNPRTFSHAFQKKYGVPPGEFRSRLLLLT